MLTRVRRTYSTSPVENSLITNLHQSEFLANQRRAPASVLNVLLLVYVIAVNVPSWLGNTPHTRDSLLLSSIVSMLTSFTLNAGWRNCLLRTPCGVLMDGNLVFSLMLVKRFGEKTQHLMQNKANTLKCKALKFVKGGY